MSEDTRSLAERMASFDSEFDKAQADLDDDLKQVTEEIARVEEALTNLQTQLAELQINKTGLEEAATGAVSKIEAGNSLLFGVLTAQAAAIAGRSDEIKALVTEQQGRVAQALMDDVGGKLMADFSKFEKETRPVLDSLPESYRPLLLNAHEETRKKLADHVEAARGGPVKSEGDSIVVEVAYAVDAPEALAELVTVIVPVEPGVQFNWTEREEDLQTHVAARVVESVYRGFHAVGIPEAQCFFGDHNGMLVIEAEIPEAHEKTPAEMVTAIDEAFKTTFAAAGETNNAKLSVTAYSADVSYLLPPEDEEGLEDETAAYA